MNKWFLVGFFFIIWSLSVFATCNNPDLTLVVSSDRFAKGGIIDLNLTFSADPSPMEICACPFGSSCGLEWQTDFNGSWARIPRNTTVPFDLNCSGQNCTSGAGYPGEDSTTKRTISCVDQNTFNVRGFHPATNKASEVVKIYCYPTPGCTPPVSGNFNVSETCNFTAVPVIIDGNYNIESGGYSIHNDSDVNFFSNGTKYVNIRDGGKIDLNQSSIFVGLTIPIAFGGPIIVGILLIIIFGSIFYHYTAVEVIG